jgi:hypothetical protein
MQDLKKFVDGLILGGRTRMTMQEIRREIGENWGTSEFQITSKFKPLIEFGIIKVDPVAVGVFKMVGSGKFVKPEIEQEAERIDKLLDDIAED